MKYYLYLFLSFIILSCNNESILDSTNHTKLAITVIDPAGKKIQGAYVFFYTTEKSFLEYDSHDIPSITDKNGVANIVNTLDSNTTYYFRIFGTCISNNVSGAITSIDSLKFNAKNYITVQLERSSSLMFRNLTNNVYSVEVTGGHKFNLNAGITKKLNNSVPDGIVKVRILQLSGIKAFPKDTTFFDTLECEENLTHDIID